MPKLSLLSIAAGLLLSTFLLLPTPVLAAPKTTISIGKMLFSGLPDPRHQIDRVEVDVYNNADGRTVTFNSKPGGFGAQACDDLFLDDRPCIAAQDIEVGKDLVNRTIRITAVRVYSQKTPRTAFTDEVGSFDLVKGLDGGKTSPYSKIQEWQWTRSPGGATGELDFTWKPTIHTPRLTFDPPDAKIAPDKTLKVYLEFVPPLPGSFVITLNRATTGISIDRLIISCDKAKNKCGNSNQVKAADYGYFHQFSVSGLFAYFEIQGKEMVASSQREHSFEITITPSDGSKSAVYPSFNYPFFITDTTAPGPLTLTMEKNSFLEKETQNGKLKVILQNGTAQTYSIYLGDELVDGSFSCYGSGCPATIELNPQGLKGGDGDGEPYVIYVKNNDNPAFKGSVTFNVKRDAPLVDGVITPIETDKDKSKPVIAGGAVCDTRDGTEIPPQQQEDFFKKNGDSAGVSTGIGCVPTNPLTLVAGVMKFSMATGGGIALLMMAYGAFQMITSNGGANLKKGQEQFQSAIIGLLFIIFSVLLLQIIGVDILQIPGFSK